MGVREIEAVLLLLLLLLIYNFFFFLVGIIVGVIPPRPFASFACVATSSLGLLRHLLVE
jgi:hypothetical protein